MGEERTIGDILASIGYDPDTTELRILIGGSVTDAAERGRRPVLNIDRHTVASDFKRWREDEGFTLLITVDDSVAEDDPNIRRYMGMGMTYPQARVAHLRNLGYEQGEIAAMEATGRPAIQKREDLAKKKLGRTILYERY